MNESVIGASRSFYGTPEDLAPAESATVGMVGDPAVNNKLVISGANALAIHPLYSGLAFTLEGPADVSAVPIQLGFKRGDRVKLTGATGTEPNHNRELTLNNPAAFTVYESLTTPDVNVYEYVVFRRNL